MCNTFFKIILCLFSCSKKKKKYTKLKSIEYNLEDITKQDLENSFCNKSSVTVKQELPKHMSAKKSINTVRRKTNMSTELEIISSSDMKSDTSKSSGDNTSRKSKNRIQTNVIRTDESLKTEIDNSGSNYKDKKLFKNTSENETFKFSLKNIKSSKKSFAVNNPNSFSNELTETKSEIDSDPLLLNSRKNNNNFKFKIKQQYIDEQANEELSLQNKSENIEINKINPEDINTDYTLSDSSNNRKLRKKKKTKKINKNNECGDVKKYNQSDPVYNVHSAISVFVKAPNEIDLKKKHFIGNPDDLIDPNEKVDKKNKIEDEFEEICLDDTEENVSKQVKKHMKSDIDGNKTKETSNQSSTKKKTKKLLCCFLSKNFLKHRKHKKMLKRSKNYAVIEQ